MSAIAEREFDRNLSPRERNQAYPRIALRERSQRNPMALFAVVTISAFAAMALVPPSGAAFAPLGAAAISPRLPTDTTAQFLERSGPSARDVACRGQAWGAESVECLATIARDAGAHGRKVRLLAGA